MPSCCNSASRDDVQRGGAGGSAASNRGFEPPLRMLADLPAGSFFFLNACRELGRSVLFRGSFAEVVQWGVVVAAAKLCTRGIELRACMHAMLN
jgi:hypothetical protein